MDKEGIIPIEKEKKTILVADDEAINRALLGNILASKYDGDAAFASCMVFVSTLASIVTLPVLCLFL